MKLQRYSGNPILSPNLDSRWDSGAVFNPGAAVGPDGKIYLLYRAIAAGYSPLPNRHGWDHYVSTVRVAVSEDGRAFTRCPEPALQPEAGIDPYGCEDARVNPFTLHGQTTYFLAYSALRKPAFTADHVRIGLAQTDDFQTFKKHGTIGPDTFDRNAVLFPEPIGGKIALIHRILPNVQIAFFDDLDRMMAPGPVYWPTYLREIDQHILLDQTYPWEAEKIGGGCPPYKTREGWLLIYHGVDTDHVYHAGLALLDLDDPSRVIARSPVPILEPEADYERIGDVPNVVFPQGLVVIDGIMHVYYGGADKVCALATAPVADALDHLNMHRL